MQEITKSCPVCDGQIIVPEGTEISEILTCPECGTRVVVESNDASEIVLAEAPQVEEDWGQ